MSSSDSEEEDAFKFHHGIASSSTPPSNSENELRISSSVSALLGPRVLAAVAAASATPNNDSDLNVSSEPVLFEDSATEALLLEEVNKMLVERGDVVRGPVDTEPVSNVIAALSSDAALIDEQLIQIGSRLGQWREQLLHASTSVRTVALRAETIARGRANRSRAATAIGDWLDALVLPPALVAELCLESVDSARFERRVREFAARLRALKLAQRVAPHARLHHAAEFSHRLKWQCVVRVREALLRSIARLQRPHTNVHVVQQTMLRRQKSFYAFLQAHTNGLTPVTPRDDQSAASSSSSSASTASPVNSFADGPDVAGEIRKVYIDLCRALYAYFFRTYYADILQLDVGGGSVAGVYGHPPPSNGASPHKASSSSTSVKPTSSTSSNSSGITMSSSPASTVSAVSGAASYLGSSIASLAARPRSAAGAAQPGVKDLLAAPQKRTSSGASTDAKRLISEVDPSRALSLDLPIESEHAPVVASAIGAIGDGVASMFGAVSSVFGGSGGSLSFARTNRASSSSTSSSTSPSPGSPSSFFNSSNISHSTHFCTREHLIASLAPELAAAVDRSERESKTERGRRRRHRRPSSGFSSTSDRPVSHLSESLRAILGSRASSPVASASLEQEDARRRSSDDRSIEEDERRLSDESLYDNDNDDDDDELLNEWNQHHYAFHRHLQVQDRVRQSWVAQASSRQSSSPASLSETLFPHLSVIIFHLARDSRRLYRFEYWYWSLCHLFFDTAISELRFQREFFGGFLPNVIDDALAVLSEALDVRLSISFDCVEFLLVHCMLEAQRSRVHRLLSSCLAEEDDEDDDDEFDLSPAEGQEHEAAMGAAVARAATANEAAGLRAPRILRERARADSEQVRELLDAFFDSALKRLMSRFVHVSAQHADSLRKANPAKLGYLSTAPHFMTRRIVDLSNSLHVLLGVSPTLRENAALRSQVERLRMDFEALMERFPAHFPDSLSASVFLVNNFGFALRGMRARMPGTVVGLQLSSSSVQSLETKLGEGIDWFVELEIGSRFRSLSICLQSAPAVAGRAVSRSSSTRRLTLNELLSALGEFRRDWDQRNALSQLQGDTVRFFTDFELGTRILTRLLARFLEIYDLLSDEVDRSLSSTNESIKESDRRTITSLHIPRDDVKALVKKHLKQIK